MAYRIAIASSNGESVNQHFGQAENFLIYEVSNGKVNFIEDREVEAASNGKEHSAIGLTRVADTLQDCNAVFVLKIGMQASRYLYQRGLKSFEVDFSLNHIFNTLLKNQKKGFIKNYLGN
jgi:predicted Fe-Mo cluster-binding NifX family protein